MQATMLPGQQRCRAAFGGSQSRGIRIASFRTARQPTFVVCAKGKGFSKQTQSKPATQQKKKSKSAQREVVPQPAWEPPRSPPPADFMAPPSTMASPSGAPVAAVDGEFSARLQALKAEAKAKAAEKKAVAKEAATPLEPAAPLYTAPPSIKDTILTRMNDDIADPALRNADIGPGRAGIAAGALLLVGVLALTSVGIGGEGKRFSGLRPARPPPDELGQAMLTSRVSQLEEKLRGTPDDAETLAALASTYGDLYKWDAAASTLERLLKVTPTDGEAWRQYGDISLLDLQSRKAVKGYEQALALLPDDPLSFTGLVNAYIADTKYQKAIDLTTDARNRLAAAATAAAASSTSTEAADTPAPAAAAAAASAGGAASTGASSQEGGERAEGAASSSAAAGNSERPSLAGKGRSKRLVGSGRKARTGIDPVEVELLQAKTFIAWRGHDNDALAVYDQAIKAYPEDYRLYQAKGLFLKERGRKADAERMFLQARYYAPSSMQQALVEMQKGPSPSVDPNAIPSS